MSNDVITHFLDNANIVQENDDITIDCKFLKCIAKNSDLHKNDIHVWLYFIAMNQLISQKELIYDVTNGKENYETNKTSIFRTEVVSRSVKKLEYYGLLKVEKIIGTNKFLKARKSMKELNEIEINRLCDEKNSYSEYIKNVKEMEKI